MVKDHLVTNLLVMNLLRKMLNMDLLRKKKKLILVSVNCLGFLFKLYDWSEYINNFVILIFPMLKLPYSQIEYKAQELYSYY